MRRALVALLLLLPGASALAQVSAQATVASDYLFRGVSLTDGRPAASLEINYDDSSGWFAGGLATATYLYGEHHYEPEYIVDVGYAHALSAGLTWEVGATYAVFADFTFWNYVETFVGLLGERWNARLYYAPDYFGRGQRAAYAEFNYAQPLDEHWRLLGHVGVVHHSDVSFDPHSRTLDASVGIAARYGNVSFALKRSMLNHENSLYPTDAPSGRGNWLLSVAYSY
jgi:uncharacterized protein (TIGR02001 family)